jgi:hypothetical protein
MKQSIFRAFLLFFVPFSSLFGQNEPISVELFALPDSFSTMIFADKANVRQAPKKDAPSIEQLVAGAEVLVLSHDTTKVEINGWPSCFHKISWRNAGQTTSKEGWIWGGLLSPNPMKMGDLSFVYGITKSKKTDKSLESANAHTVEVRAVQGQKIIASRAFELNFGTEYYSNATIFDNRGIEKIKNVLSISLFYPACGYPNLEAMFLWDGKNIEMLPSLESIGDAGAFNFSEIYIFPNDENAQTDGQIIYKMERNAVLSEDMLESDGEMHTRVMKKIDGKWLKPKVGKE